MSEDHRLYAPSTARNRRPIWAVLGAALPARGRVLEIASGTGEHICHFAAASPLELIFQPSDPDPDARASIDAWARELGLPNVMPAVALDVGAQEWPVQAADAVVCINMIHIAPVAATKTLLEGAARVLADGGMLYLYGPFRRDGQPTSPGNAEFDAALRVQNPAWGVRDLEAVVALAEARGFGPPQIVEMPANNLSVLFHRLAKRGPDGDR